MSEVDGNNVKEGTKVNGHRRHSMDTNIGAHSRVLVEPTQCASGVLCIIEDLQPRPSSYKTGEGETKEMVEDSYSLTTTAKIAINPNDGSNFLLQSMYGLTDADGFQGPDGVPMCIACMDGPREVLLLPCRHIVLCVKC